MKTLLRSLVLVAAAAMFTVGAVAPSDAQAVRAAGPRTFDGDWSVVIYTMRGDCGSGLRYAVRIVGGRVYSVDGNYQVGGAVNASGSIRVIVAEGGRSASGTGHLAGNAGRGVWQTSTRECSGQWTAARRG